MSTPIDNAAATLPQDATSPSATPQLPDPGNVLNQMPVSSPDGILGVIPHEDWEKASAKGFKKAVFATSPEGKLGVLHPEDTPKAIQKGFQLGQPTPKTNIEEGSDAWYASKIPEPVMSVLSTIGKAFAAKDKAVHVAGDLAAAVPDLAVAPSGPDPSEVVANTKMAIAKGTHYSPTMPSDEEVNTAIHNAEVKHPVAMGVSRAIARTGGEMVADPLNWPFLASSAARPALQKLISGGFATQMGAGTLESAKNLYNNWDQMTPEQRAEYATQTGLQGLFTGMAAKHAGSEAVPKAIEAGKEIAQKGTEALVQSRPVQAVAQFLKPADKFTPEQAITKAAVPKGKIKAQWRKAVVENPQTMADARRAADNLGINIEQMTPEDARDAARQGKKDIWQELQTNHPTEGGSAPTQGIADQIRKSITQRSKEGSSGWVKEAQDRAASYDERQMPLGEIEDRVSELNNKTRGIEAMFPSDKSAAKLQPENRPVFAERDALRELLLNRLDEMTGPGARELRKRYGNLGVLESALSRRVEDLASKSTEESELWKLGKIRSAGKIAKGVATVAGSGGNPLGVALGAGDIYSGGKQLQAQRMADIKRDPFWLTRKAFRDAKASPTANLSGPIRHPIAGLLKGAPIELGAAPEPEYIPPQPPPFFRTTRAQRLGLTDTERMQGAPPQPIVDVPSAPAGNDVLENQPRGTVTPLGPTGKAGVLKRPFFLKGEISPDREAVNGKPGQAESAAVSVGHDQNNARPETDQGAQKEVKDRRQNLAERKRVEHMSPEEMKKELLTSPVTGLPNKRAFDEAQHQPAKAVAMSDADGLKALNDKFGYDAGNELLKAKAEALKEAGLDAYHEKGDEFLFRGASKEELHSKLEKAREILRNRVIEVQMKDGSVRRFKGADFSHGNGSNLAEAESGLKTNKSEREARGERARGELRGITAVESRPSAVSESPAQRIVNGLDKQYPAKVVLALGQHQHPYLTPDGLMTDPNLAHSDVPWRELGNRKIQSYMKKTGYVRLMGGSHELGVEMVGRPTYAQLGAVERAASGNDQIHWDVSDENGKIQDSGKTTPKAFSNAIRRYFDEKEEQRTTPSPSVPAVRAAVKSQTPPAETPAKPWLDQSELNRLNRRVDQAQARIDRNQPIVNAPQRTPGPYVTGPSNYKMGKRLDAENNRRAGAFRELQQAQKDVEHYTRVRDGYLKGENWPNGQPRVPGAVEERAAAKERNTEKISAQGFDTRKIHHDLQGDGTSKLPDGRVVSYEMNFDKEAPDGGYRYVVTSPDGSVRYGKWNTSISTMQGSGELRTLLAEQKRSGRGIVGAITKPRRTKEK